MSVRKTMGVSGAPVGGSWPLKLCLDVTVLWPMGKTASSHRQEVDRKDLSRGQTQATRM